MRAHISCSVSNSLLVMLALTILGPAALASTIPVGVGAFGPGSTLTSFSGIADGTEVHGLVDDGITFQYSLGAGQLIVNGGPGITNNINPPNIVSSGNNLGILTLFLPSSVNTFGYGFATLSTGSMAAATTLSLFQDATNVGFQAFAGVPDPLFAGGFAGIQSTIPFNRVALSFNANTPAFALDDIRTFSTPLATVSEPPTLMLLAVGSVILLFARSVSATPSKRDT